MMVVINAELVERELERRSWNRLRLASEMGVSHQTVTNMFDGGNLLHKTQVALFNAFGGRIEFAELFVVTAGEDAAVPAEEAVA
jgi:plasmid maintenance system antidote protein VapI